MFYGKLVDDLENKGFVLNPYNPCVANNEDLKEVTEFRECLSKTYRILVVSHRGKAQDYLGRIFDY